MKGLVYVKFPKTGLGNLLLIWARAKVFAHINDLQIVTSSWWGIRLGAWLRMENRKRLYFGYFKEDHWITRLHVQFKKIKFENCIEPRIEVVEKKNLNKVYIFNKISTEDDLFGIIRKHRDFVKTELYNLLTPALKKQLSQFQPPEIAVHIRRGDFKLGNPITPISFFKEGIEKVRCTAKKDLQVTIFTDADQSEVDDLLELPGVVLAEKKADILDILLMSQSKVIFLSQSSTFSYWAAFLSEGIIVKPHNDWQGNLRPDSINQNNFEGKIDFNEKIPAELVDSLNRLKYEYEKQGK